MAGMTIGELAARTGLRVSAIRYYQRRGLLPAPDTGGAWQRFGADVVGRLTVIALAKSAGFSLDEIGVLLAALYGPTSPASSWQAMGEAKLAEVDAQIARLHQMRRLLTDALAQCHLDPGRNQIIATALDWASTSPRPPAPAQGSPAQAAGGG
jgi:MerR family transcriptional regulator, redox-sensitive transcriptional activator SoxR